MADYARYRIRIDEDWSLEDLYLFPRAYEQVYFFFASFDVDLNEQDREKIERAYRTFPWQGGYSAVSFFNQLKYATPPRLRPTIIAIQKSSPGYFDLGLWLAAATSLAVIVNKIASAIDAAHTTYNNIYKGMQERKLLRIQVESDVLKFESEHMNFINTSSRQMAQLLGFSTPVEINRLTGNPYLTLKLLLSVYRRVRTLSEYQNSGKAHLTEDAIPIQPPPSRRRRKQPPPKARSKG